MSRYRPRESGGEKDPGHVIFLSIEPERNLIIQHFYYIVLKIKGK